MNRREFKIFIDFDGTITETDVGEGLFYKFGEQQQVDKIIVGLLDHKISAKECWIKLCNTVDQVNESEWNEFIDNIKIDPYFHKFIQLCESYNADVFVLSDGFSFYIDRIFKRESLSGLKYFSNRLTISGNKLIPEFPFEDPYFRSSANCKRNHIINNSGDDDVTVYIGDGNSDIHAAQFCDYIFAKEGLLKHCEKERISYSPYSNFNEVTKKIEVLFSKRNIKKRHQAELKRKEAYKVE